MAVCPRSLTTDQNRSHNMQIDSELAMALFGLFFLASLIASYNMGWHSGHDIHHDDKQEAEDGPPTSPPPTDSALWR